MKEGQKQEQDQEGGGRRKWHHSTQGKHNKNKINLLGVKEKQDCEKDWHGQQNCSYSRGRQGELGSLGYLGGS